MALSETAVIWLDHTPLRDGRAKPASIPRVSPGQLRWPYIERLRGNLLVTVDAL